MKRFSQRNSLVTLNEINITPLLDLAFVLLIIFIITRPLIEQNIDLQLPQNMGRPDTRDINRHNIRMVEINARGEYWLQGRKLSLAQLEYELDSTHRQNPKLIVDIRADKRAPWGDGIAVVNACQRHGITQFSIRTSPSSHP
ncbi:MAG TPA: biopolymer transporter ExbD [Verrucomicrobiae bacterium]|jgi:biopolymer transport protein ExbD/biopolymer transport protein TolR|nr:biopolymer transporter ExbD [Verrucomicrobiae bacterium]